MTDPSPSASSATAASTGAGARPRVASGLGWLAAPVCLVLLGGVALPPGQGLVLPLLVAVGMAVVGQRRVAMVPSLQEALARGAGSPAARASLLVLVLLAATVLLTVLVRGVGSLLVDFPAAQWGVAAALVGALAWAVLAPRVSARGRPVLLLLLALGVPWAGVSGTRYEAEGQDARGWAHSGPILGIHPFQITAVIVDGEGPFDIPLNDYVEPDGTRGYGPQEYADAMDRALASIAERVYPQGPARIRHALIDAEVEAVVTPAVWERLDREPFERTQPRILVRSGSFGHGSRIEFVCPGRRVDPRGAPNESVMNKMCPDKYAAEASAGLGVTGRWSGYSEGRGNPRSSLSRWLHWTRSDDDQGHRVTERLIEVWGFLLLGLLGLLALPPGPTRALAEGLRGVGGAVAAITVVLLVVGVLSMEGSPAVGSWPSAHAGQGSWLEPLQWAPALALGGLAIFSLGGPAATRGAPRAVAVPAIVVVVATMAVAASLPALAWIDPLPGPAADGSPGYARLPAFVRGLAEAIGQRRLTIFEMEGVVASVLAVVLLAGGIATLGAVRQSVRSLVPPARARDERSLEIVAVAVTGLVLVGAAALCISRKTAGAAALMPGVIGMLLLLGSGLHRISRRDSRRVLGVLAHLGWTALALAMVWLAVHPLPWSLFVLACTAIGVVAVVVAGLASLHPGSVDPAPQPLERDGAGRL